MLQAHATRCTHVPNTKDEVEDQVFRFLRGFAEAKFAPSLTWPDLTLRAEERRGT